MRRLSLLLGLLLCLMLLLLLLKLLSPPCLLPGMVAKGVGRRVVEVVSVAARGLLFSRSPVPRILPNRSHPLAQSSVAVCLVFGMFGGTEGQILG